MQGRASGSTKGLSNSQITVFHQFDCIPVCSWHLLSSGEKKKKSLTWAIYLCVFVSVGLVPIVCGNSNKPHQKTLTRWFNGRTKFFVAGGSLGSLAEAAPSVVGQSEAASGAMLLCVLCQERGLIWGFSRDPSAVAGLQPVELPLREKTTCYDPLPVKKNLLTVLSKGDGGCSEVSGHALVVLPLACSIGRIQLIQGVV